MRGRGDPGSPVKVVFGFILKHTFSSRPSALNGMLTIWVGFVVIGVHVFFFACKLFNGFFFVVFQCCLGPKRATAFMCE